jgi:hypothetical protein
LSCSFCQTKSQRQADEALENEEGLK